MGRFGLLAPDSFAITGSSVERCQFRLDPDVPLQRPAEGAPRDGPLEAREAPARVGAATRLCRPRRQHVLRRDEPEQLALGGLAATADAASGRIRHAAGVPSPASSCSTGIPAGTSCAGATAGWLTSRSTSPAAPPTSVASGAGA